MTAVVHEPRRLRDVALSILIAASIAAASAVAGVVLAGAAFGLFLEF